MRFSRNIQVRNMKVKQIYNNEVTPSSSGNVSFDFTFDSDPLDLVVSKSLIANGVFKIISASETDTQVTVGYIDETVENGISVYTIEDSNSLIHINSVSTDGSNYIFNVAPYIFIEEYIIYPSVTYRVQTPVIPYSGAVSISVNEFELIVESEYGDLVPDYFISDTNTTGGLQINNFVSFEIIDTASTRWFLRYSSYTVFFTDGTTKTNTRYRIRFSGNPYVVKNFGEENAQIGSSTETFDRLSKVISEPYTLMYNLRIYTDGWDLSSNSKNIIII